VIISQSSESTLIPSPIHVHTCPFPNPCHSIPHPVAHHIFQTKRGERLERPLSRLYLYIFLFVQRRYQPKIPPNPCMACIDRHQRLRSITNLIGPLIGKKAMDHRRVPCRYRTWAGCQLLAASDQELPYLVSTLHEQQIHFAFRTGEKEKPTPKTGLSHCVLASRPWSSCTRNQKSRDCATPQKQDHSRTYRSKAADRFVRGLGLERNRTSTEG
jgi:hypothetical protein